MPKRKQGPEETDSSSSVPESEKLCEVRNKRLSYS